MIVRRSFASYDAYVYAQGGKARGNRAELLRKLPKQTAGFRELFHTAKPHLKAGPMLCLGARTGAEMIAAEEAGFHGSVGIDLHPVGKGVRQGDWHSMPEFDDGSFANVYTNSFDHCLMLERACDEVRRVLEPGGRFYLMASDKGVKNAERVKEWQASQKHNEAIFWSHSDDLCDAVLLLGFRQRRAWRVGGWGHYILEPK